MAQAFKKAAIFGDIHYGLRHNNRTHNQDCENFLKWMIDRAHSKGAETCIFLGDYHHHRASVNVSTLNYMVSGLRMLNDSFEKTYFIVGNHDLFYREKREIHSLPMAEEFPNIVIANEIIVEDGIAVVPWLVGDEWKSLGKIPCKYMFGHFELPHFKMNAMVEMPDHGGLNADHFQNPEIVFTGHFHKRQQSGRVHYVGSPFGHNYADAWDFDRGFCTLEWGGEPEYHNWPDGPRYISTTLSKLIDNADQYLQKNTYAKVLLDIDITYEEATFLRETFMNDYDIREIRLVPQRKDAEEFEAVGEIKFQTVDQIVLEQLAEIESDTYNTQKLVEIYNSL